MSAYRDTAVHWSRSQTAIVKMLAGWSVLESRFTNLTDKFALEFRVVGGALGTMKPVSIRIVVPLRYEPTAGDDTKRREKELNRLHRVLFYHLKAKFTAIESGLTEFMEEFMPHLIIMDNKGNSSTMAQVLLPQYVAGIESGQQKEFKLLGDGK